MHDSEGPAQPEAWASWLSAKTPAFTAAPEPGAVNPLVLGGATESPPSTDGDTEVKATYTESS